jgi:hypothetical protein
MNWFGKKKSPALDPLPTDERWSLAQGENDGKPMFVRVNSSAKEYARHPDLSVRLGIAIPLHAPNDHGLPVEPESEQLQDIEDNLLEVLAASGRLVLVITTCGMREFVSYVRSSQVAEEIATQIRAVTDTHKVQHYAESDPKWDIFGQFA